MQSDICFEDREQTEFIFSSVLLNFVLEKEDKKLKKKDKLTFDKVSLKDTKGVRKTFSCLCGSVAFIFFTPRGMLPLLEEKNRGFFCFFVIFW